MTVELRPIDLRPNVNAYELLHQIDLMRHFYRTRGRNIRPSYNQSVYPVLSESISNDNLASRLAILITSNERFELQYAA